MHANIVSRFSVNYLKSQLLLPFNVDNLPILLNGRSSVLLLTSRLTSTYLQFLGKVGWGLNSCLSMHQFGQNQTHIAWPLDCFLYWSFAVRVGLLYIISGLGGSLLSALFLQSHISVGASGALFGSLGGMLSELITNWSIYVNKVLANLMVLRPF